MRTTRPWALGVLTAAILGLIGASGALTAQDSAKDPRQVYAYDLRVRTGGSKDFDTKTPKFGVEFFLDEANGVEVALSQSGYLAAIPAPKLEKGGRPELVTAYDLRARKSGEEFITQDTRRFGVEVFKDLRSNRLIYISEVGSVALAPVPASLQSEKGTQWHHGLSSKVRGPEQMTFDRAKPVGVEVFKDENTGGLIYITEVGAIADAPSPEAAPDKTMVKRPLPVHGLVLRVRGAEEVNFTDKTKRIGVEVFEDPNANRLFFLSETGAIATAPKPAKYTGERGVTWKSAMKLKVRKGGETDFSKAAKFGVEVFQDNQTGYLVYICESGSIAVVAK